MLHASTAHPGKCTESLLVSDGFQCPQCVTSVLASCLPGVCEPLDHNKRLLMTEAVGLSGGKPLCTHLISQNQETPRWRGKREEEWFMRCQWTDWKCSYKQQISLSDMTAFPLTSFLALGRSMRIFKARRSWLAFFTQTLNREKRGLKRTQSTQQPVRPWSRC